MCHAHARPGALRGLSCAAVRRARPPISIYITVSVYLGHLYDKHATPEYGAEPSSIRPLFCAHTDTGRARNAPPHCRCRAAQSAECTRPALPPPHRRTAHIRSRMWEDDTRAAANAQWCNHAHATVRRRRTDGDGGAQQPCAREAGADRVGVEVRIVGGEVAAPREVRVELLESQRHGHARGNGGGAARRLGHDPHGARRALVAARGTGQIRACARPCSSLSMRGSGLAAAAVHPSTRAVPTQYSAAAYRPPDPCTSKRVPRRVPVATACP
jgi:hypothetical protein